MDWQVTIEPVKQKSANPALDLPDTRSFPAGTDQIVFGRERTCDVVFPPDARMVGGMHGRLFRQPSGDYAIEAFGDHYFELNGYHADQGQAVPPDATIRLGGAKGPEVRVKLSRGPRTDGLLSTLTQASAVPLGKAMARMGVFQRILAAVVVIAVAAGAWVYWTLPDFDRQMASLRQTMSERARDSLPPMDAVIDATYGVIRRDASGVESMLGTAWAYKPGMLVTNAHVASVFNKDGPDTILVRRPGGADHVVTGTLIHPGYQAFKKFVRDAEHTSNGFRSMTAGLAMPSAYDVAILQVEPAADMDKMLEVAADSGSAILKSGVALAAAGFPIEGTGAQNLAQLGSPAQLQFGSVTSVSDYFLFGTDDDHAYLVQNSVPASGGASGSPIVDKSGKVVAVLSGGNITMTANGRAPNAVMLNYAQRADLIRGVIDPTAFDLPAEEARWNQVLPRFDSHELTMLADARRTLEQTSGAPVADPVEVDASLKAGRTIKLGPALYREHEIAVEAGHTYHIVLYGERGSSLGLTLYRGEEGIDRNFGGRWFASLDYASDRNETLKLRVVGSAETPVGYKLYTFSAPTALAAAPVSSN